jgi:hypothetical protein
MRPANRTKRPALYRGRRSHVKSFRSDTGPQFPRRYAEADPRVLRTRAVRRTARIRALEAAGRVATDLRLQRGDLGKRRDDSEYAHVFLGSAEFTAAAEQAVSSKNVGILSAHGRADHKHRHRRNGRPALGRSNRPRRCIRSAKLTRRL